MISQGEVRLSVISHCVIKLMVVFPTICQVSDVQLKRKEVGGSDSRICRNKCEPKS